MKEELVQFQVSPAEVNDLSYLYESALERMGENIHDTVFKHFKLRKKSIDARKKPVKYNVQILLSSTEIPDVKYDFPLNDVRDKTEIHIIGAGPAGLFAALEAIALGFKPVLFERGKDVRQRRRDLANINKLHLVDADSNYCFGEGGAGTYSDGKLYTRSKKRGNTLKAMEWFAYFGAPAEILVDAHPHIGTNKLPQIIVNMRETIIKCGGEVHFNAKLTDVQLDNNRVKKITINNEKLVEVSNLILATGHSARDIFYLLHEKNIRIDAKGFAIGVRIEHPQELIDHIQYHGEDTSNLPPAAYSLVSQASGKGVYSFCMCPGGIIAPCATDQEEVVTNGWSPSKRNNAFANSGMVVSFLPEELPNYSPENPFTCLDFQKDVEKKCWLAAGKTQAVPAQRLLDFIDNKTSVDLPKTSYQPGIVSVNLNAVLPASISEPLRKSFLDFGRKMKGFLTNEAVLHAPESRTSSPVSIPRDAQSLEHIEVKGLYPCGEGAGYAGGIISAAVDGMNCVQAIAANKM